MKPPNLPNPPNLRSLSLCLLTSAAVLATAGCINAPGKPGPEPEVARPEQVLAFAALYAQNCAACHGEKGKNGAAISLANPVYLAIAGALLLSRSHPPALPEATSVQS